jgi:sugar phosphate isomerase/epimerase
MHRLSRRTFLKTASASAAAAALWNGSLPLMAYPLGLPLGLQLYSVRSMLPNDYAGTLQQLGALGYREVEAAGFFNHSLSEVKAAMDRAGLHCVSAHNSLADLMAKTDEIIQYGKSLGLQYIVCSSPRLKDPSRVPHADFHATGKSMTLDDWRWNADQFNRIGKSVSEAGMRFAYHNHTPEFRSENGILFYDELLRLTDPLHVTMELDCGWAVVAGQNPAEIISRYPTRISMLHVKDFKMTPAVTPDTPPTSTELGRGTIDYHPIFAAARKAHIEHMFVEQEEFDVPAMEALRIDADYMHAFTG